jgi:hypothetical protein
MAKLPADRPADATAFVSALNAAAGGAYGPDWADRGRSQLGGAALLLAALWPSGGAPAVQGGAVQQVNVQQANLTRQPGPSRPSQESRHWWHLRHLRHLSHLRQLGLALGATATAAVVAAAAVLAVTSHHAPSSPRPSSSASPHRAAAPAPPPTVAYATISSIVLRRGAGAPHVLGTFPANQQYPTALAWSPDGKEVAWLAYGTLNLTPIDGGPTRHWACTSCSEIAFQGDQVVTVPATAAGSDLTAASAQLLVFPADGSAPATESITGIPTGQTDTDFHLMGDSPAGTPVVAFGDAGGSDDGGPQQLYRVDQAGDATEYGKAPAQSVSGYPSLFAAALSGDLASFATYNNFGACGGIEVTHVVSSLTGAVTVPAVPSGGGRYGFWV